MSQPLTPSIVELPPAAVDVVRRWGSRFQSARVRNHVGMAAVALEMGYGRGDPRAAARALDARLAAGRIPADRWGSLAFLVYTTNDSAWAALKTALDADTWARTCAEVETLRASRPLEPAPSEPLPPVRRGRPIESRRGATV